MGFSSLLSSLMKKYNTTDGELAEYVGVSRQAIYRWRNGSKPSFDKMLKVADFFDIKIDEFGVSIPDNKATEKQLIPIVGNIQAGYPVESFEVVDEYVSLPTGVTFSKNLFALRVVGDSMMPLVMEGDIIICDRNTEYANGRICAVTVDGESTLKRVKADTSGITLSPTNPMYREIHYSPKKAQELGFHIDGVLVQMIRNF